jgi:hypothetical protein
LQRTEFARVWVVSAIELAIASHRICLQKLLISWKNLRGAFDIPLECDDTAHLVVPWTAQVHRFGEAFLKLEKQGYEHETHPLVRSALEYAIVGHWAAHVGHNAVVARYGEDQRKLKALLGDLSRSRNDLVPTQWKAEMFAPYVDEAPLPPVDEEKLIRNFESICDDVGVHNNIYPAYRMLCWITHPTTYSANLYLAGERTVAFTPVTHDKQLGYVGLMAYAVFWSRRTVDDLTTNHPHRDWLDELAQSIQVMPRLPVPRSTQPSTAEESNLGQAVELS